MEPEKLKIVRADLSRDKNELHRFIVEEFCNNPLQTLLPVPSSDREKFFDSLASGNCTSLAFYDNDIIGCRTGNIIKYGDILKV